MTLFFTISHIHICITTQTAFHSQFTIMSLLCLLQLYGFAFTSFHLRPAFNTAAGELYATLLLAAIQRLIGIAEGRGGGAVWADFNLITFEQRAPSAGSCGSPVDVMKPHY